MSDAGRRRVRFGLWYAWRNPQQWRTTDQALYEEVLEQIAWAETIGFDDVWMTEHHFVEEDGHAPSPLVQAAAVAMRTKTMRIGTAVLLLPLYHPVRVAEDAATVDILSGGRFDLGVGIGYRLEEFAGLGISRKERGGRMNEGLEIIRRLWDGERLTFHGKYFRVDGVKLAPLPVQKPRPPIWVGGFGPAALKRAATLGDGYMGTADTGDLTKGYLEELRAAGKDPARARVAGGHFWLIVSEDPEKAWSEVGEHIRYQLNVYAEWLGKAGQTLFPPMEDVAAVRASGAASIVTPDEAVAMMKEYLARVPLERYFNWTIPPGYPVRKMNEHLELFARKVIPRLR